MELSPASVAFTHEGGAGGLDKENQDAHFVAQLKPDVLACAVLDGHGKKNGRLASRAAAAEMEAFLRRHVDELSKAPEATLRRAFEASHEAVRRAMLEADPELRVVGSGATAYLLDWVENDDDEEEIAPTHKWDAADGGTTATVAVLLGRTLVVAACGDSSAVLLALDCAGAPVHEQLVADHGPTNGAEHARLRAEPRAARLRWVYDACDAATGDEIAIFDADGALDAAALARADAADVALKNSRGERCTIVWVPEAHVELPARRELGSARGAAQSARVEEQATTMTRSLGDFYAHHHGVTWEPEVRTLELGALGAVRGWRGARLLLASDGVWDLWEPEALAARVCAGEAELQALGASLCEETRARGAEYFDEAADNLTGVLVDLEQLAQLQDAIRLPLIGDASPAPPPPGAPAPPANAELDALAGRDAKL